MWNDNFFKEIFYNFLITQDGQFVVFLNDKYHYIFFDQTGQIKNLILWKKSRQALHIDIEETVLKIDNSNNLKGQVVVDADLDKLNNIDIQTLTRLGFEFKKNKFSHSFKVFGKRYLANGVSSKYSSRLGAPYSINVYFDLNQHQKITKATLTPITLVIDSLIISGKILTFPFRN